MKTIIDKNYLIGTFAFDVDKMPKKYSDEEIKFICEEAGYRINFLTESVLEDDNDELSVEQKKLAQRAMAVMAMHWMTYGIDHSRISGSVSMSGISTSTTNPRDPAFVPSRVLEFLSQANLYDTLLPASPSGSCSTCSSSPCSCRNNPIYDNGTLENMVENYLSAKLDAKENKIPSASEEVGKDMTKKHMVTYDQHGRHFEGVSETIVENSHFKGAANFQGTADKDTIKFQYTTSGIPLTNINGVVHNYMKGSVSGYELKPGMEFTLVDSTGKGSKWTIDGVGNFVNIGGGSQAKSSDLTRYADKGEWDKAVAQANGKDLMGIISNPMGITIGGKPITDPFAEVIGSSHNNAIKYYLDHDAAISDLGGKVVTVGGIGDVDMTPAGYGREYLLETMLGYPGFKAGEKGRVVVSSTGDVTTYKTWEELSKVITTHDYSAITTQKDLYDKVVADNIQPGESLILTVQGQKVVVQAQGLNTVARLFTYGFVGAEPDALGNYHAEIKKASAHGLMTLPLNAFHVGDLRVDELNVDKQVHLTDAATKDDHAVRLKEYTVTKDLAIDNKLRLDVQSGATYSITAVGHIDMLSDYLEHELTPLPTVDIDGNPATYADWTEALTNKQTKSADYNLVLDMILDKATGDFITKAQAIALGFSDAEATKIEKSAQWAKTYIVDATPTVVSKQPVKVEVSYRPYESPLASPPKVAKNHDAITLIAKTALVPQRLVKELLSLPAYQETDGIIEVQKFIDAASQAQTGEGFQVAELIKAVGQPGTVKFGDGQTVNQQAGPGYDKDTIDQAFTDTAGTIAGKANIDLGNVVDLAHAGKMPKLNDVTGKLEWVESASGSMKYKYVPNPGGATAAEVLIANPARGEIDTIMTVHNAKDRAKLSYDEELVYLSKQTGPDPAMDREWQLLNPRHMGQGTDAFKVITRAVDNQGPETWTVPESGAVGYRDVLFMDFNFGTDPVDTYVDTVGLNKHTIYAASSRQGQADSVVLRVLDLPPGAYDSDELRLTLEFLIAWRQGTTKLTRTAITDVLVNLEKWYQDPTAANLAPLNAAGYARGYLYPMIYQNVHLSTLLWNSSPTLITTTRNDLANDADLNKFALYGTKDADGTIHIFAKTKFYSSSFGGHVAMTGEFEIEDAEVGHQDTTSGALQTIKHDIDTNNKKVADIESKAILGITSTDGTVTVTKGTNGITDLSVVPAPIDDSDDIEKTGTNQLSLTQVYKDKVTKQITDADKALATQITTDYTLADTNLETSLKKLITDEDKKLDDKIEVEKALSDSKSKDNKDMAFATLDAYGVYEKVSSRTHFETSPLDGTESVDLEIKAKLTKTFKWDDGEKFFVRLTTEAPYNGHASRMVLIGNPFGSEFVLSGDTKDENVVPATFSMSIVGGSQFRIMNFKAGTTGLAIDDIFVEEVAQATFDPSLPSKVAANEQTGTDNNKLISGVVDALKLAKIYEVAPGAQPAGITKQGTTEIYKGIEHTFTKSYPVGSTVLIRLANKQLVTVPIIATEADIKDPSNKLDLPGGTGYIHAAVIQTAVTPATNPPTWTFQVILDDITRSPLDPANIDPNVKYAEIVATSETPAPVDLSAYDTAAATALKISGAIAQEAAVNTGPLLDRKMNQSMDNFQAITIPGYQNGITQKLVKDAFDNINLVEDVAPYKIYGNKLTLGIATGMKDRDLAYVVSEDSWYRYDDTAKKWVTKPSDDTKVDNKLSTGAATAPGNQYAIDGSSGGLKVIDMDLKPIVDIHI